MLVHFIGEKRTFTSSQFLSDREIWMFLIERDCWLNTQMRGDEQRPVLFYQARRIKNKIKCWSQMSHELQQRRRDGRNEMRHFDSCKRKRNSAWFRVTFGEAALHDQPRRQRQLTCALFKICEAERTGSTRGINTTAQVSESLVRGLKLWFKQSLLHGNTFLRLELGLDKHFISYSVLFCNTE